MENLSIFHWLLAAFSCDGRDCRNSREETGTGFANPAVDAAILPAVAAVMVMAFSVAQRASRSFSNRAKRPRSGEFPSLTPRQRRWYKGGFITESARRLAEQTGNHKGEFL
jgi:hypothetical protein